MGRHTLNTPALRNAALFLALVAISHVAEGRVLLQSIEDQLAILAGVSAPPSSGRVRRTPSPPPPPPPPPPYSSVVLQQLVEGAPAGAILSTAATGYLGSSNADGVSNSAALLGSILHTSPQASAALGEELSDAVSRVSQAGRLQDVAWLQSLQELFDDTAGVVSDGGSIDSAELQKDLSAFITNFNKLVGGSNTPATNFTQLLAILQNSAAGAGGNSNLAQGLAILQTGLGVYDAFASRSD